MTAQKILHFSQNRTLHIRLPDHLWNVLFAMTSMDGQTPEEYCLEAIRSDIEMSIDEPEYFGKLICQGWKQELEAVSQ